MCSFCLCKLDDINYYTGKLSEIIKLNDLKSITVLRMEVPCCSGIVIASQNARDTVGSNVSIKVITISIEGKVMKTEYF